MIKIAVLGYGTVGSGVVEVLSTNKEAIALKAGQPIEVKYVLDLREFPGTPVEKLMTKNYQDILNDNEVSVVVEVLGGIEPAFTFAKQALAAQKSVVTSNKELVATHGPELLELARDNQVNFLFEASVGGGIPIIRPLNQSLTADEIQEITGILNGTTNYILTKMAQEGVSFEEALKEAQDLGYAERNPAADVEGHDSCRKIAILASLSFGLHANYEDIYTEGITKITTIDMVVAQSLDMDIKLIATSKKMNDSIYARVAPTLIKRSHPLYNVHDVFNAIYLKGNVIGEVMFYGRGAGKLPTASAVVADVVDCVRHVGKTVMTHWSTHPMNLVDIGQVPTTFLIRIKSDFMDGVPSAVNKHFGQVKMIDVPGEEGQLAFITQFEPEMLIKEKVEQLLKEAAILDVESMLRIEL
jgi:homoserine dehydrogenase